jgi:chaperonin cofactor prefoldin
MFKKKKKDKDFNFKLKIIEKIGTLETQNKFLMERIVALEEEIQKHRQGGN